MRKVPELSGPFQGLRFACNSSSNAALAVFSFNPVTDYRRKPDVKFIMNTFYIIPHSVTEWNDGQWWKTTDQLCSIHQVKPT